MSETKVFPARIGEAVIKSIWRFNRLRNHTSDLSHKVLIFSGAVVGDVTGLDVIELASDLTLNFQTNGVNGLDTGALAINTWYAIYLIKQPGGTVSSLASTNFTTPLMPAGYVYKRIVGAIVTDGSSNLTRIEQADNQVVITSHDNVFTNGFPGGFSDYNLSAYVPPCSRHALIGFWIYCYDGDRGQYFYAPSSIYTGYSRKFLGNECRAHDDNDNTVTYNAVWLPVDENRHICIGSGGNRDSANVRVQGYTIDS